RIALLERRVAEAELVHGAGTEILDQHVGASDQAPDEREPAWRLDVERKAALVAVEAHEEAGARAGQAPRVVARGRLDLDDVGAEIGEDEPAGRAHRHMGELDDANCVERQGRALGGLGWAWAGTRPFGSPGSGTWP